MASDKEGRIGKFMSTFCYETDTVAFLTACENEHEERLLSPRNVEGQTCGGLSSFSNFMASHLPMYVRSVISGQTSSLNLGSGYMSDECE